MQLAHAESLWNEDFSGYGIGGKRLEPGRILTVTINSDTNLTFSSVNSGERELILSFTGGETGDLFSFLPDIQSSRRNTVEGEEEFSLSTSLAVRVRETSAAGMSYVEGSRTRRVDGGVQAVTVSGWLDPQSLNSDGSISFDLLADGTLTYRTFAAGNEEILGEDDITAAVRTAESSAAAEAAGSPETAADGEETAAAERQPPIGISDARKRELLLEYINSFLDIIFTE